MNEVLFFKTFVLVGGMLVITAIAARINKAYETTQESILTIGGTFLTLFIVWNQADVFRITSMPWPPFRFASDGVWAPPSPCSGSHSNLENTGKNSDLRAKPYK